MVKVYFLNADEFNESDYEFCYNNLSEFRKKCVDKFSLKKDKVLSCFSGALLSYALKKDFNLDEKSIKYSVNKFGKPYFTNEKGIYFNISHSGNFVMLGISDSEIGVDIQKIKDINERLISRFSKEEIALFDNATDKKDLFFRLWTIKESYIKFLGNGLTMPLNSFTVSILPKVSVKESDCSFVEFSDISGYKACVCFSNGNDVVSVETVSKKFIIK